MMILDNKLGITSSSELRDAEERLSKARAAELFANEILDVNDAGSFAALAAIHQYLFQDIYDFAGQVRSEDIAKDGFRFASSLYLADAIEAVEKMPQSTFDEIVKKYVEMNVVHPFREGNGRSMRIWLDDMLRKELGMAIDWSQIDKQDYLLAMERSPIKDTEITLLLKDALSNDIHNREMFMKGIDASYAYEGYEAYRTEDM